ncbi:uncharacterized protein LOC130689156 isoform X2 [Daphnia carinata]|uniref:uncharacterized protein LOC130689156 isoform X2 n=1 Tax=Daphnia carinata TaxID=120202 RepID=UPI00257E85DC|nr:uncharacterized protein LOC130689156 isoform X2 [Daphnia carinata]
MWGYLVLCSLLLSNVFTPSFQSPQSSFFRWSTDEAKQYIPTESQTTPAYTDKPKVDIGQSLQFPVKEKLAQELMPSIPVNLSDSEQGENLKLPNTTLPVKGNLTSGLKNYIGDEVSSFLATSVVFLGAVLGREGCELKAACLVGSLVPPLQGRDIAVIRTNYT